MGVAILRYGSPHRPFVRLGDLPLAGSEWHADARPMPAFARELGEDDHLLLRASSKSLLARLAGVRCRVSIWLREPPSVQGRMYAALPLLSGRFHRVLTHQASLAARCKNACVVPHGGTMVRAPVDALAARDRRIGLVASSKASTHGHRLRHRIARWASTAAPDMELMGRGYREIASKSEGHLPFMYSVVIENGSFPGYFTEKLVDCLLCGSVPIYWGDPDFAKHFDPAGIVYCRDEGEIREAVLHADAESFESRRDARLRNARAAMRFAEPGRLAARALEPGSAERAG